MKKLLLLLIYLLGSAAIFAQNKKKEGDDMVTAGNYNRAVMMYRLCMEQDEECKLLLIRLIYEKQVEPQSPGELLQLADPLAQKGNAEVQCYLGILYFNGFIPYRPSKNTKP